MSATMALAVFVTVWAVIGVVTGIVMDRRGHDPFPGSKSRTCDCEDSGTLQRGVGCLPSLSAALPHVRAMGALLSSDDYGSRRLPLAAAGCYGGSGTVTRASSCCRNGTAVEVYELAEMDTPLMWEFFERHPRRRHSLP